jgi:hypothetical protein
LTQSGKAVDLIAPDPSTIDPGDIAHALAHLCRFTGHTRTHYSVAQHSAMVAMIVSVDDCPTTAAKRRRRLAALLHDAAEAYLQDLSSPLKLALQALGMGNPYAELERRMVSAIAERFGLFPSQLHHPSIKYADLVMLATERRDLLPAVGPSWGHLPEPLPETLSPQDAETARECFLDDLERLAP